MHIFCSGIGGIGLSAYAAHMKLKGHSVSGSDKTDSPLIEDLRGQGITVSLKQDGSALPEPLNLLVYSEAIPETAPERALAKKRGVRQISYFHALGELTEGKKMISISGTHGKSSTTAMVARVLIDLAQDPNIVVGTKLKELNGRNWRQGRGELWAVESCEYRRSFHFLSPKIIVLTNADGDHFDAYASYEDYRKAFVEFVSKLPDDGVVIGHGSDAQVMSIVKESGKTFIDADTEKLPQLTTPGTHMQQNAQLVLALVRYLKLDVAKAEESLKGFAGTWRRMEVKGKTKDDVLVIDDYAHHPVEIKATLKALKEANKDRRLVCLFQPHTHDRTLKLWNDFASAFTHADVLILTDIYDARPDTESEKADIKKLVSAIKEGSKVEVQHAGSVNDAEALLRSSILKPHDLLVVMGAGNVTEVAGRILM